MVGSLTRNARQEGNVMKIAIAAKVSLACTFVAVTSLASAYAKDCVQLSGGACKGHWACTTADGSSGFCTDPPAGDCYCKKGKRTRVHHVDESMPAEAMPPNGQLPENPGATDSPKGPQQDAMPGNLPH